MPNHCIVINCNSKGRTSDTGLPVSFYRIPAVKETNTTNSISSADKVKRIRREEWLKAINRDESILGYGRVCSKHFITGKPAKLFARHHIDWTPSVLMGGKSESSKHTDKIKSFADDNKNVSNVPSSETSKVKSQISVKPGILKKNINKQPTERTMFQRITHVLTSTLHDFNAMATEVEACFDTEITELNNDNPGNVSKQSDLCNEISALEKSVKNVEGMVVESLMITDSDLKKKLMSLRFENSSLKKERAMLQAHIALLENQETTSQIPQTIIYNLRDTDTILLVTDDYDS